MTEILNFFSVARMSVFVDLAFALFGTIGLICIIAIYDLLSQIIKRDRISDKATEAEKQEFYKKVDWIYMPMLYTSYVLGLILWTMLSVLYYIAVIKKKWRLMRIWMLIQSILFLITFPIILWGIIIAEKWIIEYGMIFAYYAYRFMTILVIAIYSEAVKYVQAHPQPDPFTSVQYYSY